MPSKIDKVDPVQNDSMIVSIRLFNTLSQALQQVASDYLSNHPEPTTNHWAFFTADTDQPIAKELQAIAVTASSADRLLNALVPLFKKMSGTYGMLLTLYPTLFHQLPLVAKCHQRLQESKQNQKELSDDSSYLRWDISDYQYVISQAAQESQQLQDRKLFASRSESVDLSL